MTGALAVVGGRLATELVDVTDDLAALESSGFWAVVLPFEGQPICARFAEVRPARPWPGPAWRGPRVDEWTSSLSEEEFKAGVRAIRASIEAGDVYQVNLTRRLSALMPEGGDIAALGAALAEGNPAPYSAVVRLPSVDCHVASASPERFLWRDGDLVSSSPIKGTAPDPAGLTAKDAAENVMIVDLVRNDLGRVCEFGSVSVPGLLALEHHPGLVHLVSTVSGRLRPGCGWPEAIAATFPPGSVTGAPKVSALEQIAALEPVGRGVYCGAVGWVDADATTADLAVGIRTFWFTAGAGDDRGLILRLGVGAGITWASDPALEWQETELKAATLLSVASGSTPG